MKKYWNNLKRYPLLLLFFTFLFSFMVLDGLWPKRQTSELERRPLAQFPTFSWNQLFANQWTKDYDNYTKDQFVFRDSWLRLQSRSERLLFTKTEIGGAVIGKDGQLFTKMFSLTPLENKLMERNTQIMINFAAAHEGHVTFMLVPSASLIYEDKLPAKTPMLNESQYLDDIFAAVGASGLDLRTAFADAKDQQLYYKTDHHWTTDGGAFVAYQEYCKAHGFTPASYKNSDFTEVENFYGTTYAKCLLWNATPDTIHYLNLPNTLTVWKVAGTGELSENFSAGLYDMDKAATMDKYSMFLHGNNGYTTIKGNGEGKLLVVKDSYANSLVPYLLQHYAEIGMVDPRDYKFNINDLMEQEGYDDVLVLFNFQTFVSNQSISSLMPKS